MNEAGITISATVPTGQHALELVEPGEQAFDLPSALVSAQCATVLRDGAFAIGLVGSNQLDALGSKSLIEWVTVVGAIPNKAFGSSHGDNFIEGSLDKGDFMWASRRRVHSEWKTRSVCNNHELRTLSPLGLSHFWAPFFASTKVPSMKHSARLIWPTSSRCCASTSSICRNTPLLTQREKRRKQVAPEGNRSGKSAQAAPVRNTHRMPFMTARLLCNSGLPRPSSRRGVSGIRGSRIAHCSSVSSSLLAIQKS
jgi:hypothetical protein